MTGFQRNLAQNQCLHCVYMCGFMAGGQGGRGGRERGRDEEKGARNSKGEQLLLSKCVSIWVHVVNHQSPCSFLRHSPGRRWGGDGGRGAFCLFKRLRSHLGLSALTCPPWDHILTDSTAEGLSLEVCCGDDKLTQQGVPHIYLSTNY